MNTAHQTRGPAGQVFHRSSHTRLSENVNPATGRREQVMTTSRLEMGWDTGVLVINWRGNRVLVDVENEQQRARRRPF
ncbi:hypothetical protein [Delftia acidovorans]|uniref:hypothetical protein n=1 Tax=Delftia acidovorans TaxID=80866 RepID=UPI00241EBDF2|nr:hypothetical protein [Delftia acidovorans]